MVAFGSDVGGNGAESHAIPSQGRAVYLYGTFEHSMDDRGRVAVPAAFRRELLDGGVLRPAEDGCLELYTHESFTAKTEEVLGDSDTRTRIGRQRRRTFLSRAHGFQQLDRQGRIVIPPEMREHAGLDGRVVLVGLGDYVELWDLELWESADRDAEAAVAEGDA
ncbi:MAG: cell division/cell wall cluster transcriptional repressor MraZ [Chloroflexi bacterium]|nr:cell division/cell wall cluster transcriptional repressor MraZ [Chloroflexota bacterium]